MIKGNITLVYMKIWIRLFCSIPQFIRHRKITKENNPTYIA